MDFETVLPFNIQMKDAVIRWKDDREVTKVTFGVIPDGVTDTSTIGVDDLFFYWLTKEEAKQFAVGFSNDDWTVVEV